MGRTTVRVVSAGALALALVGGTALVTLPAAEAQGGTIGVNVLLRCDPTSEVLADLGGYGQVLDVIPQIRGVTLRAKADQLAGIRALPWVAAAGRDARAELASAGGPTLPDFSSGANHWALDAIDVTDSAGGRTVDYDGAGVYVAVVDTGLPNNWRAYFPEARIDASHARAFGGGGGNHGNVSTSCNWEHDTNGHGAMVTAIVLGFHYDGPEALPADFNGVAPGATVIPVRVLNSNANADAWASVVARGVLYVADLKAGGELGASPVVINLSLGYPDADVLLRAAIDYAIERGVVVVASAGNGADAGMAFPARYAPVISAGASGWRGQFTSDDAAHVGWILDDVPEGDAAEHYIAPFSAVEFAGQDLDVVAPGFFVPGPYSYSGQVDYTFLWGTSAAAPHVAGVAALLLQKNPGLEPAEVESILEGTTLPIPAGSARVTLAEAGPGNGATWSDHENVFYFDTTLSWGADATGHGLLQADAALAATPQQ